MAEQTNDSSDEWYTERLIRMDADPSLAKRAHTVMYRAHIRRLAKGRVLDVGCGIGMNLRYLSPDSVGVDHNPTSIAEANRRGLHAFVPADLHAREEEFAGAFDTLLAAHVLEHVQHETAVLMMKEYLPYLKPSAKVVMLTPQDPDCVNDPTHVRYVDFAAARTLADAVGLKIRKTSGFPLPVSLGKYRSGNTNEIVVVAER